MSALFTQICYGEIMKKLLGIMLLFILSSVNAHTDEIKIKRIECKSSLDKERYQNYFFIISSDNNSSRFYSAKGKYDWMVVDYVIKTNLFSIKFFLSNLNAPIHTIDRETGVLNTFGKVGMLCTKMKDNFDPEKFLKDQTTKNMTDKEKNNKF